MTAHSALPEAELHENKGASTATIGSVPTSNGAGATVWQKVVNTSLNGIIANPLAGYFLLADGAGGFTTAPAAHGSIYFSNFAVPYSLAATTAYQKIAPTTAADGAAIEITEGTNARLTYNGVVPIHLDCVFSLSFDQSTGSDKDIFISLYKTGVLVPGSEIAITTVSGKKTVSTMHRDVHMSTGDYLEMFCKVSAATTVLFYTANLQVSTAGA